MTVRVSPCAAGKPAINKHTPIEREQNICMFSALSGL
jgi:hypothetical protein